MYTTFPDEKFLDGEDLKIGGEGMRGFYDQILPKEIGRYIKPFGAKIEISFVPIKDTNGYVAGIEKDGRTGENLWSSPITAAQVTAVLKNTPFSNITVLSNPAELQDIALRDYLLRNDRTGVKGLCDQASGRAYLFAANHTDLTDALLTARDEMFHRGIYQWAKMVSQTYPETSDAYTHLNAFMGEVLRSKRDTINAWLSANGYAHAINSPDGANEWLTHVASRQAPRWYDRYAAAAVRYCRTAGKALGFDLKVTDAEIRAWTREVKQAMGDQPPAPQEMGANTNPLLLNAYQNVLYRTADQIRHIPDQVPPPDTKPFPDVSHFSPEVQKQLRSVPTVRDQNGRLLAPSGEPSNLGELAWRIVRTEKFKTWFGDWETPEAMASRTLDRNGEPKILFHGTKHKDIRQFIDQEADDPGFYFTDNPDHAALYTSPESYAGGNILPVFLDVVNPYAVTNQEWSMGQGLSPAEAKDMGYDAYIIKGQEVGDTYIAFSSNQVKSAIGNDGNFDRVNTDIRQSNNPPKAQEAAMNMQDAKSNKNVDVDVFISELNEDIKAYKQVFKDNDESAEELGERLNYIHMDLAGLEESTLNDQQAQALKDLQDEVFVINNEYNKKFLNFDFKDNQKDLLDDMPTKEENECLKRMAEDLSELNSAIKSFGVKANIDQLSSAQLKAGVEKIHEISSRILDSRSKIGTSDDDLYAHYIQEIKDASVFFQNGKLNTEDFVKISEARSEVVLKNIEREMRYRRMDYKIQSIPISLIRTDAAAFQARLADPAPIIVHADHTAAAKALNQSVAHNTAALYYGGQVHLIASAITDRTHLANVLVHEELRHHGLRRLLEPNYQRVMEVAWKNPMVKAQADALTKDGRYTFDLSTASGRSQAADEAIAHLADTGVKCSLVDKIVSYLRGELRATFKGLPFSNAEVRCLIGASARRAVYGDELFRDFRRLPDMTQFCSENTQNKKQTATSPNLNGPPETNAQPAYKKIPSTPAKGKSF